MDYRQPHIEKYLQLGFNIVFVYGVNDKGACGCGNECCLKPGKHPVVLGKLFGATNNVKKIMMMSSENPIANIGILMDNHHITLDIDINGKRNGFDTIKMLEKKLGALPLTVTQKSGSGGEHRLFRCDNTGIRNRKEFVPGVDVKSKGSYIIVEPSLHRSGSIYNWVDGKSIFNFQIAKLPDKWIDFISFI